MYDTEEEDMYGYEMIERFEEEEVPIIKKQQTSPVDTEGAMFDIIGTRLINKFFDKYY